MPRPDQHPAANDETRRDELQLVQAIVRTCDACELPGYLDRLDDEVLCAVACELPGGQASVPPLTRTEIRAAVRRRRAARGWDDWPIDVRHAAIQLAATAAERSADPDTRGGAR